MAQVAFTSESSTMAYTGMGAPWQWSGMFHRTLADATCSPNDGFIPLLQRRVSGSIRSICYNTALRTNFKRQHEPANQQHPEIPGV